MLVCCEQVYELSSVKDNWGRSELLNDWQNSGGVMIMGYEMFRNLSQSARVKNKKQKKIFGESLLDPGHCCAFWLNCQLKKRHAVIRHLLRTELLCHSQALSAADTT